MNDRLERWRHTLEVRGFRLSRSKTEYLHCRFNERIEKGGDITLDGMVIPNVAKFKYLDSIIQQNGDTDEDISQWIRVGWQKWKSASGVLCDKRVSLV